MGNGFTTEQMLEFIWEDVKASKAKLDHIIESGCPMGKENAKDISSLNRWKEKTTNRVVLMLLGVVSSLIAAIYGLFSKPHIPH